MAAVSRQNHGCREQGVEILPKVPKVAAPTCSDSEGMRGSKGQSAPFPHPDTRESRILIQASRLILGVFGANILLNLRNLHSLIMHFPRIEGDVLTDIACGTVLVLEAKQIVLMAEIHHASAEAR